jgi:DNA helicase HerA-like ATPase
MGNAAPFKPQPPPIMMSYVSRMANRLRDRRFDFMLNPGPYDGTNRDLKDLVADWLDHPSAITVLDLAGVPAEVTDLVVGVVTRILFEIMSWGRDLKGIGRQRPLLIVFEEAHQYLPSADNRFIQGYARRAVQRIFKEGRKYGVGGIVVSQRPSDLDETILSQCGTFISLRLTNSSDQGRIRATVPDEVSGLIDLLPTLRTGEALVSGEAIQIPSRTVVDLVDPRPRSDDPAISETWARPRTDSADYAAAVASWRKQSPVNPEA